MLITIGHFATIVRVRETAKSGCGPLLEFESTNSLFRHTPGSFEVKMFDARQQCACSR
jgi:hypothetical protein